MGGCAASSLHDVAFSGFVFAAGHFRSRDSYFFRGRGPAKCTVWERVEVRSGSLAKLFLWSSLSFRKLAFPSEKPSRDILVVQSSGACEMSARRNHWQERELWKILSDFATFLKILLKFFTKHADSLNQCFAKMLSLKRCKSAHIL